MGCVRARPRPWQQRGLADSHRRNSAPPRDKESKTDPLLRHGPNFSPDGKWITFVRVKKSEKLQALFAVHPDGTGLHQLTPFTWEIAIKHDWSPDGKTIVLTENADWARPNDSANIITIRTDGSGKTKLTHFTDRKQDGFVGSFSPDGKQIVFRLEQGGKYALAVIDSNGSNMRLITKMSATKPRGIDWGTHP